MSWKLKTLQQACDEQGFNQQLREEMLWNEGYRLGRRRWYWGPSWMVDLQGWINTRLQRGRRQKK